jgi:hypothetical protein
MDLTDEHLYDCAKMGEHIGDAFISTSTLRLCRLVVGSAVDAMERLEANIPDNKQNSLCKAQIRVRGSYPFAPARLAHKGPALRLSIASLLSIPFLSCVPSLKGKKGMFA